MNFCENCNFLLYKKLVLPEDGDQVTSGGEAVLLEYCKNCGNETPIKEDSISVYKREYKSSFAIDSIISNKYIVYDNTLPRLSIDCKNKDCITQDKYSITAHNALLINNLPENITNEALFEILANFKPTEPTITEVLDDIDYVKTINGHRMFFKRLRLCEAIVYFTSPPAAPGADGTDTLVTIMTVLKAYLDTYPIESDFKYSEPINVLPFSEIRKEVLFVKYDPENMKYLYMCVNCGTSW